MIRVICLGKLKEKYLIDMINDYQKRINKYYKIEIIELKDSEILSNETNLILNKINDKNYLIVLDINGKSYSSEEFSEKLSKIFTMGYGNVDFIIGGSNGV